MAIGDGHGSSKPESFQAIYRERRAHQADKQHLPAARLCVPQLLKDSAYCNVKAIMK